MGQDTAIEWCDHTFNHVRGCTKVSDGCKFCYAETLSKRYPGTLGKWGPSGERVIASESYWKQPLKWNRDAERAGERRRVFCASLADVFEDSTTMPAESWLAVCKARERLFALIEATPNLDWLLLTKRPQRVIEYVPERWTYETRFNEYPKRFPANVWIGTSVEDQATADERIPHLLKIPARVLFLSAEPLIGPVVLPDAFLMPDFADDDPRARRRWLIAGGESGPNARVMLPDWVRDLRDQCAEVGLPFLFKQWGDLLPYEHTTAPFLRNQRGEEFDGHGLDIIDPETGDMGKGWHEDSLHYDCAWKRVGKKAAGRLLDGKLHDGYPEAVTR